MAMYIECSGSTTEAGGKSGMAPEREVLIWFSYYIVLRKMCYATLNYGLERGYGLPWWCSG